MATYAQIPITPDILSQVFDHLWPRGREELRRVGIGIADAYQSFMEWSRTGRSGALTADGVPVLVCGIYPESDRSAFTYMACSEDFDKHWRAITRTMRRELKAWPGVVYIYSVCVHDEAEAFFRVLGFERDGWTGRTAAGHALYRFSRKDASKLGGT